ncbi:MAG: ribosomal RNA small subunit methyltransferase A [Chloroflexi bacterium]|nr:ribosomal RNA small subunit methyltransferase A [Chloroflexota bacterium]
MSASPARVDPARVRETLKAARLRARHSLSQNFLVDVDVLDAILAAAAREARPGRRILEVGPGLGVLTRALLDAGAAVTAIELDRGLVAYLRMTLADELARAVAEPGAPGSLRLLEGDVLDQDLATLIEAPFDVVANIPYHITSPILHRVLELPRPPDRIVLMVQREVAERIAAPPGKMSYLSVFVQYHASVAIVRVVPPDAFEPAPDVESAIVLIEPHGAPALVPERENELWRLVQAAFRERRKMLHNVLARQLPMPAPRVSAALEAVGIAPGRRPQTVSVEEWIRLLAAISPAV